jgi:hypothetical protein
VNSSCQHFAASITHSSKTVVADCRALQVINEIFTHLIKYLHFNTQSTWQQLFRKALKSESCAEHLAMIALSPAEVSLRHDSDD